MNYSEEIKQKIKNLYLNSIKIGKIKQDTNLFNFLNKYEFEENIQQGLGKTVSNVSSYSLQHILTEIKNTPYLFNMLGTGFIKQMEAIYSNRGGVLFLENNTLKEIIQPQNQEYIIKISNKSEEIANKYGLKECYYVFNPYLSEKKNFIVAMLGFDNLEKEFTKIQKLLKIEDSYLIGNSFLGIELSFNKNKIENLEKGEYNSCSNTIVLSDKDSIPLVHEYVHFIDKTSTALLLTGKTTQELFEAGEYSAKDIVEIFNMNNIVKMKSSGLFNYFDTYKFNDQFQEEIKQNNELYQIFNQWLPENKETYIKNFKNEVFKWIYKQPITNKDLLCKEFNDIIESKKINHLLINKDDETYQKIQIVANLFKMYSEQNNENNFMLFSKILDAEQTKRSNNALFKVKNNTYYQSQREMLARTIERYGTNTLQELSNILTTPSFDEKNNQKIVDIVSLWKNNIDEIILLREKIEVSDRIQKISKRFNKNTSQIEKIKSNI